MRTFGRLMICVVLASLITLTAGPSAGQLTRAPAAPEYKYSTPMPRGIAVPDKVETHFGTLNFLY